MVLAALLLATGTPTLEVTLSSTDGEVFLSVRAESVPVSELLQEIAFRTGRVIEKTDDLPDQALTIDLVRRPLAQVVHYVSGAAGLRGRLTDSSIVVQPDVPLGADPDELDLAAEVQYMLALRRFPDHGLAASAEMTLGLIQEDRGRLDAARDHYDLLVQRHRRSPLVPEALWRSGRLLEELGRWSEAWTEFSALVNHTDPHPYRAGARYELARISIELGDAQQAEYLIDALDRDLPAETRKELRRRLVLRGSIALANERPNDALRALDQVDRMGPAGADAELETLRAQALEATRRYGEAGRAWLAAAGAAQDDERRANALSNAARLAYSADDDLAVLFVDRHARGQGLTGVAEPWLARSRERIGMADTDQRDMPRTGGLAHVDLLVADRLWQEAFDEAGRLLAAPASLLDDEERLRAVLARAHAAAQLGHADDALNVLRDHLNEFERVDERKRVYLRAGELLESLGRFDEAADAYGGKL